MTAVPTDSAVPQTAPARRRSWLDRVCARLSGRLGGWCDLLRGAHDARVPF